MAEGSNGSREDHKQRKEDERGRKTVDRFRASSRGLRRVFQKHFPAQEGAVETLVHHLAQVEAHLPNTKEAIRLARYPGAGDRNPKRMALGLMQNLSALESHLRHAQQSLEELAKSYDEPRVPPREG